ncbi:MAG: hypothetical protein J0L88_02900 [Xanthomonadales bacterium]|nr:hypothetical protein [Xanthomonadales bacterium]
MPIVAPRSTQADRTRVHDPHARTQRLALQRWIDDRRPLDREVTRVADIGPDAVAAAVLDSVTPSAPGESLLLRCRDCLLDSPATVPLAVGRHSSRIAMLLGDEHQAGYERALASLPIRLRGLVILRIEFGLDPSAMATELGQPEHATRKATLEALGALAMALSPTRRRAA